MKSLALGILLLACSGCTTVAARSESKGLIAFQVEGVYPGTRLNCILGQVNPLFLLDLPISVAVDTLLFPYDVMEKGKPGK